jgi:hypothetical protein
MGTATMMRQEMVDKINKQQKRIQELEFENMQLRKKNCVGTENQSLWSRFLSFCKENERDN